MRQRTFIALICAFILSACTISKEEKAHKLIDKHLQETLNDYKSYESVKFGELKQVTARIAAMDTVVAMLKRENKFGNAEAFIEKRNIFEKYVKDNKLNVDTVLCYSMTHEFRAKNRFGAYVLSKYKYVFTKDLQEIYNIKENN